MSYDCKVIADTINQVDERILTLEATYPRIIHSEMLTHRDRARNSGSSRAIPWATMSERIQNNPFIPIKWGLEQKGMQSGNDIPQELADLAESLWLQARDTALKFANEIHNIGKTYKEFYGEDKYKDVRIHKSIPNRITEPWMWITVVMTSTCWTNFFKQRVHKDAEVHMERIASMMLDCVKKSRPVEDECHLPYIQDDDWKHLTPEESALEQVLRISTARCARVSYVQHGQKVKSVAADLKLGRDLESSGHWSPFEHPCTSLELQRSGCYKGWKSYRKWFPTECQEGGFPRGD